MEGQSICTFPACLAAWILMSGTIPDWSPLSRCPHTTPREEGGEEAPPADCAGEPGFPGLRGAREGMSFSGSLSLQHESGAWTTLGHTCVTLGINSAPNVHSPGQ